jgi:hypothetical protein
MANSQPADNQTSPAPAPKHPGRTAAQRRALDAIGCGNYAPIMARATRDALLRDGLIEPAGERRIGTGALAVVIQEFQMPISVHMAWCAAAAAEEEVADA